MGAKLLSEGESRVSMHNLVDGDVAVVVDERFPEYASRIVQKVGRNVVSIGMPTGRGWTGGSSILCRKLHPGTHIALTSDEGNPDEIAADGS